MENSLLRDYLSTSSLGGGIPTEKCGICSESVTTRGVLDCCSHAYCFGCIQSWFLITNLCPLCKIQFKSITYLPIVPIEDSSDDDTQHTFYDFFEKERDESWHHDDEDGALCFPSYLIDEDAVVCLNGDGCHVRGGASGQEGENTDTLIACNSCDCWYHSLCVGYNPSNSSQGFWVCPRCTEAQSIYTLTMGSSDKSSQKKPLLDGKLYFSVEDKDCSLQYTETRELVDMAPKDTFNKNREEGGDKITQVADIMETSLPVFKELYHGKEKDNASNFLEAAKKGERILAVSMSGKDSNMSSLEIGNVLTLSCNSEMPQSKPSVSICTEEDDKNFTSIAHIANSADLDMPPSSLEDCKPRFTCENIITCKEEVLSTIPEQEEIMVSIQNKQFDNSCSGLKLFSVEDVEGELSKKNINRTDNSKQPAPILTMKVETDVLVKQLDLCQQANETENKRNVSQTNVSVVCEEEIARRKAKLTRRKIEDPSTLVCGIKRTGRNPISEVDSQLNDRKIKEETADVLTELVRTPMPNIHRDVKRKVSTETVSTTDVDKGLRIGRIMHNRSNLDAKVSQMVEKIRQQIKEAAGVGATKDLGVIDVTDDRFLAAFKAAMVKSKERNLQKRKIISRNRRANSCNLAGARESLTKKLYGGSGKRRQAYDRDWDIAFGMRRARDMKRMKMEEEEDTGSDLAIIYKALSDSGKKKEEDESILARLYPADTSLFPRNSDIQPLSMSSNSACTSTLSGIKGNNQVKIPKVEGSNCTLGLKPLIKDMKVQPSKAMPIAVNSSEADLKRDKRKWALDVLARKSGQTGNENSTLKASSGPKMDSTLLAQIPMCKRPVIEYDRRSRVPTAIRQVYLDRFVEYELQSLDPKHLGENMECETAIQVARNKEKEIYDKSNSKVVYVNLSVQALTQPITHEKKDDMDESHPSDLASSSKGSSESEIDAAVFDALRATGLVSDSPPDSPSLASEPIGVQHMATEDTKVDLIINGDKEQENTYKETNTLIQEESCTGEEWDMAYSQYKMENDTKSTFEYQNSGESGSPPLEDLRCVAIENKESEIQPNQSVGVEHVDGMLPKVIDGTSNTNQEEEMKNTSKSFHTSRVEEMKIDVDKCGSLQPLSTSNVLDILNKNDMDVSTDPASDIDSQIHSKPLPESFSQKEISNHENVSQHVDVNQSIRKKVEVYVKEHIRPLCKSGVISTEQYQWTVEKTTSKIMQHHPHSKSANFLIAEGDKVKKLAEQYLLCFKKRKIT